MTHTTSTHTCTTHTTSTHFGRHEHWDWKEESRWTSENDFTKRAREPSDKTDLKDDRRRRGTARCARSGHTHQQGRASNADSREISQRLAAHTRARTWARARKLTHTRCTIWRTHTTSTHWPRRTGLKEAMKMDRRKRICAARAIAERQEDAPKYNRSRRGTARRAGWVHTHQRGEQPSDEQHYFAASHSLYGKGTKRTWRPVVLLNNVSTAQLCQ